MTPLMTSILCGGLQGYVLVALLMRISDEGTAAVDAAEQAKYEADLERRRRLLTGN